jgi:hypothetical protein
LVYDFHDQILEPDEDTVTESFRYIRDSVSSQIGNLVDDKKYKEIKLIGISLGCVPLSLVADRFTKFTSVTQVVGGDDLAIDMWHGARTQHVRRGFEKMHVGVRRLAKEWDGVAPENHLRHFKNKPVKLVISLNDSFVGTKYQKKLAKKIAKAGAKLNIKHKLTGHSLTIINFCLFGNP